MAEEPRARQRQLFASYQSIVLAAAVMLIAIRLWEDRVAVRDVLIGAGVASALIVVLHALTLRRPGARPAEPLVARGRARRGPLRR